MKRIFLNPSSAAVTTIVLAAAVAGTVAVLAHATVPGKNGAIAFKMALGHPSRLAIVNADGTGERMLPRTKGVEDGHPDWSPRGSTIVFHRCLLQGTGRCAIFTMRAGGTGLKRLAPTCSGAPPACEDRFAPAWSPNGRAIAFSRAWGPVQNDWIKFNELFVMNASGRGLRQITRFNASKPFSTFVEASSWSPDGKRLVFEAGTSSSGEPANGLALFVVNADGSDLRQLTPWNLNAGDRPDWSPDGGRILFKAPAKRQHGNLYTISPDGSDLKQLTNYPPATAVFSGSFSPDGKWITFAKSANVFVMRADGTGARQITRGVSAWAPDWGALHSENYFPTTPRPCPGAVRARFRPGSWSRRPRCSGVQLAEENVGASSAARREGALRREVRRERVAGQVGGAGRVDRHPVAHVGSAAAQVGGVGED